MTTLNTASARVMQVMKTYPLPPALVVAIDQTCDKVLARARSCTYSSGTPGHPCYLSTNPRHELVAVHRLAVGLCPNLSLIIATCRRYIAQFQAELLLKATVSADPIYTAVWGASNQDWTRWLLLRPIMIRIGFAPMDCLDFGEQLQYYIVPYGKPCLQSAFRPDSTADWQTYVTQYHALIDDRSQTTLLQQDNQARLDMFIDEVFNLQISHLVYRCHEQVVKCAQEDLANIKTLCHYYTGVRTSDEQYLPCLFERYIRQHCVSTNYMHPVFVKFIPESQRTYASFIGRRVFLNTKHVGSDVIITLHNTFMVLPKTAPPRSDTTHSPNRILVTPYTAPDPRTLSSSSCTDTIKVDDEDASAPLMDQLMTTVVKIEEPELSPPSLPAPPVLAHTLPTLLASSSPHPTSMEPVPMLSPQATPATSSSPQVLPATPPIPAQELPEVSPEDNRGGARPKRKRSGIYEILSFLQQERRIKKQARVENQKRWVQLLESLSHECD